MRSEFENLRLNQLQTRLNAFGALQGSVRPRHGWLRTVRQALGLTSADIAEAIGSSRQLALRFEKSEEADSITLRSLRHVADAMGCELVYALVPKTGTLKELVENRLKKQAREHVVRVEHSMALEDQAVGHVVRAVESEVTRRRSKRDKVA